MTRRPAIFGVLLLLLGAGMTLSALAQGFDPTPVPYYPGTALITLTPTLDPNVCLTPLPITLGQIIYIEPQVNIRNLPTESGGIVWNTIYDNTDAEGRLNDRIFNIAATVVEGPVCSGSLNWWKVTGLGAPGWVAEGRPERDGYFLIVPSISADACASLYTLRAGTTANLLFNVRVRAEASLDGLVKTVAPAGTPVELLRGGDCAEGLKWWFVRVFVAGSTYEGWMTESDGSDYWLVPRDLQTADGTQCDPPLRLATGQRATVNTRNNGDAIALRALPSKEAGLLASLVDNVPLVILAGPVCAENLNWWQVRVEASNVVIGWMAQGSSFAGTWIFTTNPDEFRYDPVLDQTPSPTPPR